MSFNKHLMHPRDSLGTKHILEIIKLPDDHTHQYQCRCIQCNCHVKWSSAAEYTWYTLRAEAGKVTSFNKLFWAPQYVEIFAMCQEWAQEQKSENQYQQELWHKENQKNMESDFYDG